MPWIHVERRGRARPSRLSIVDLADGQQPMSLATTAPCWITFNGEIFNYVELRDELIARGGSFAHELGHRSDPAASTTERAPTASQQLNGDFAFAIWDVTRQRLCWRATGWACGRSSTPRAAARSVFASEVKALLAVPGVDARARPDRARPDLHALGAARRRARPSRASSSCRRRT